MTGSTPLLDLRASGSHRRLFAAAMLLVASLTASLVFYGTAVNLVVLALAVAALLGALTFVGTSRIADLLKTNPSGSALAVAILGYLAIAYRFSLSPDSSFAPSWALASGPIAFLCTAAVVPKAAMRHVLVVLTFGTIVALATNSSIRFVVLGERAHQPLFDPNNYASLMYLVWIPFVHWHLVRGWRKGSLSRLTHSLVLAASFLFVFAIFATRSRTSSLVVFVAFAVWGIFVAMRGYSSKWLLAHLAIAAAAWIGVHQMLEVTNVSMKGLEFGSGVSVRRELIHSAFAMFEQHPLGVGVFCFPLLYPMFRSLLEQETAGLFVHNDYVQFLVEGGVPLLVLFLIFVSSVLRRGFALRQLAPEDPRSTDLGVAIALAAVCLHAAVNFVFYCLPLSILIGIGAGLLFANRSEEVQDHPTIRARGVISAGIVAGWAMWLYLVIDVAIVGVFQGQPSLRLAAAVRADESRMLEFARFAQQINGRRGVPALGEALLLHRAVRAEPESDYLRQQAYAQFRRALAIDPWNTLSYVRFSQFLDEFPPSGTPAAGESDEELLLSALALDPVCVPAIDQLMWRYSETAQGEKQYRLLRNVVFPWMAVLRRNAPDASSKYFDQLETFAQAEGDASFLAEIKARRDALRKLVPQPPHYWFL